MNVPRTSAEPAQAQSQHAGETGPGRGKTVTSACERCRRRKIRCDGETPCATCRRFRIGCIRIQKNDTHALEQRVRQLEAQIREFSAGISNTHGQDATAFSTPQPWPEISLSTDFGSPGPAVAMDQTFSQFQPGSSLAPLEIPSIQVVDYADSLSPVSPVSPVSLSPSPMLRPLASGPPKPCPESFDSGLRPPGTGPALSPPMTACPSPNHSMPYLSPRSLPGPSRSRSSSISSLGLDADWASGPGDLSVFGLNETDLDSSFFNMSPTSPDIEAQWTPTRFEAETLLDKFFDRTQRTRSSLPRYPLVRNKLFAFLDIVHHAPAIPPGCRERACSVSMARFHVYMAMAIGLRMDAEGRSSTMYMLENCYRLAMEETREPSFWKQAFALEAATLVMLFAQVSGQD